MLSTQFTAHPRQPVKARYKDVIGVQRARWLELALADDNDSATIVVFAPSDDFEPWLRETAVALRELANAMQEAADREEAR